MIFRTSIEIAGYPSFIPDVIEGPTDRLRISTVPRIWNFRTHLRIEMREGGAFWCFPLYSRWVWVMDLVSSYQIMHSAFSWTENAKTTTSRWSCVALISVRISGFCTNVNNFQCSRISDEQIRFIEKVYVVFCCSKNASGIFGTPCTIH